MSTIEGGEIQALSVTQVETFDHSQKGGCERRWFFNVVKGLKPEQDNAQSDGTIGHGHLSHYFKTGEEPKGRVKMGKAVRGAIAKGKLPKPGPDMLVEWRFDGQPQRDAGGNWIPLKPELSAVRIAGVPWDGQVDLAFNRTGIPVVLDHKFTSDILQWSLSAEQLIRTVQLPVYVDALRSRWPDAKQWRIAHHYVSRSGVESDLRHAVVSLDQIAERIADVARVVERMKGIARAPSQDDVPFNLNSCSAWRGCPHQSICSAYRRQNSMDLTPEEQAMFAQTEAAVSAPAPEVDDEEAALARQIETIRAKKAAAAAAKASPVPPPQPPPASMPAPVAAKPPAIWPDCGACGAPLNPDNGSRRQDGSFAHIGCPAAAPPPMPAQAATPPPQPQAVTATEPPKRGRPPKAAAPVVTLPAAVLGGNATSATVDPREVRITITLDRDTRAFLAELFKGP